MAITAATKLSDLSGFIKPDLAQAYFEEARRSSVVQRLARQVPLSERGIEVPMVTEIGRAHV